MSGIVLRAAGLLDPHGLAGSGLLPLTWDERSGDPLAGELRWSAISSAPWREFRRLDLLAQALLCAAEAAGLREALAPAERPATALVLATRRGCLGADLAFQASLRPGAEPEPARFPWTLPSTCLGELALRHDLRGPTLCLGAEAAPEAALALREARLLLECGEAAAAVVAFGDVLAAPRAAEVGLPPRVELGLVVVAAGPLTGRAPLGEAEALAGAEAPWALLREWLGAGVAA